MLREWPEAHKPARCSLKGSNMGKKLSHALIDLGFFSVLGTSEHPGMKKEEVHVKRGTPNTFDSNNSVTVVYDEEGRPWIIPSKKANGGIWDEICVYQLRAGAYVPHSNDGGNFLDEIAMKF